LFAVPGAFTPGCQVKHLPPFVEKYEEFKNKGVDIVAVISANDAFVRLSLSQFPVICRLDMLHL
jgi:alkyl hydroperoxide reductase 1